MKGPWIGFTGRVGERWEPCIRRCTNSRSQRKVVDSYIPSICGACAAYSTGSWRETVGDSGKSFLRRPKSYIVNSDTWNMRRYIPIRTLV
jgi:hypothetical protein